MDTTTTKKSAFDRYVTEKVRAYFKENNISQKGDWRIYSKTIFFISLLIFSYYIAVFADVGKFFHGLGWLGVGISFCGLGMGSMHDASHNAYSKDNQVNKWVARILNLMGAEALMWYVKHVILHHDEPNVDGVDDDIESGGLLRFSKEKPFRKYHKYQPIYAWFLYAMLTFLWMNVLDFRKYFLMRVGSYEITGWTFKDHFQFWITKIWHWTMYIALPIYFTDWKIAISGYFIAMAVSGLVLSCVFQCAHVLKGLPILLQPYKKESRFRHQLADTSDFKTYPVFEWFIGGLNYQVAHHLFPDICHIHYSKIVPIIKEAIFEWNSKTGEKIIYHEQPSFLSALKSHTAVLIEGSTA